MKDFVRFAGITWPDDFRAVTRAHVMALGDGTVRHRLASLAPLFQYLCNHNAVKHNPVNGVARPKAETGKGRTPTLCDHRARELLDAPAVGTVKSKRDRAILSTLLFHTLRRDDLSQLTVRDFRHALKSALHLRVSGKGGKTRYLPSGTHALIHEYPEATGSCPPGCHFH